MCSAYYACYFCGKKEIIFCWECVSLCLIFLWFVISFPLYSLGNVFTKFTISLLEIYCDLKKYQKRACHPFCIKIILINIIIIVCLVTIFLVLKFSEISWARLAFYFLTAVRRSSLSSSGLWLSWFVLDLKIKKYGYYLSSNDGEFYNFGCFWGGK